MGGSDRGLAKPPVCVQTLFLPTAVHLPQQGFCVPFAGPCVLAGCHNLKATRDLPVVVSQKVTRESAASQVAGPSAST